MKKDTKIVNYFKSYMISSFHLLLMQFFHLFLSLFRQRGIFFVFHCIYNNYL